GRARLRRVQYRCRAADALPHRAGRLAGVRAADDARRAERGRSAGVEAARIAGVLVHLLEWRGDADRLGGSGVSLVVDGSHLHLRRDRLEAEPELVLQEEGAVI